MRKFLILIVAFLNFALSAQPDTEVYVFDLSAKENRFEVSNQRNISNNKGYDNQPSFYNDTTILFAATRNGQTDIAKYNVQNQKLDWISNTQQGSEYSPTKIPNQKAISAIRLDTTGKQLVYRYDDKKGTSEVLINDLIVGYHTWFTKDIIVSSVLEDGGLSLVISNLADKTNKTVQKKVGRSLHKIPNSQRISYISKENDIWEIKSLDPVSGVTQKIIHTIPEAEDMCWLSNGAILMGKGNKIFKFNPKSDKEWSIFYMFQNSEIQKITRIAVNSKGTLLALVSETSQK